MIPQCSFAKEEIWILKAVRCLCHLWLHICVTVLVFCQQMCCLKYSWEWPLWFLPDWMQPQELIPENRQTLPTSAPGSPGSCKGQGFWLTTQPLGTHVCMPAPWTWCPNLLSRLGPLISLRSGCGLGEQSALIELSESQQFEHCFVFVLVRLWHPLLWRRKGRESGVVGGRVLCH